MDKIKSYFICVRDEERANNDDSSVDCEVEPAEKDRLDENIASEESSSAGGSSVDSEGREQWARNIDFLFACIGFSVGLGNVWRFPYLCYKNGGGAFLIPYLVAVLLGGIPLFFLEVAVGQFMSKGGVNAWKICPVFQGIGFASAIIVFFLNCYYNVILCWSFYYMFSSFAAVLPWAHCDNPWNSENCTLASDLTGAGVSVSNLTTNLTNRTVDFRGIDPVTEFWEKKVLAISSGIDEIGGIKWDLALCLLLAWIVVYFCIWKGIKSSGKVMYFTAPAPYILMAILIVRGACLPGAMDGIIYYLKPDWNRLRDVQVWVDAGTQIFFSYSISLGTLTALGSYNKFNHNSYRDSILFASVNSCTSLFAGFLIFSILGYMAYMHNVAVSEVAASGPGLAFIAYPKAVAQMPCAPLWSILFFTMIILLGLDSQFVGVEGFVTACVDAFPTFLRKGRRREIFIACVCLLAFFIGLSMVTNGGMYVFQLFDYYSGSRIILLVALMECIAIGWVYDADRFYSNLQMMLGYRINCYMKICWKYLSPIFCIVIFTMSAITYSELTYDRKSEGTYVYPSWAVAIGWVMACISVVFIPIIAVIKVVQVKRRRKPLRRLWEPRLKPHQQRAVDPEVKACSVSNNTVSNMLLVESNITLVKSKV